MPSIRDLFDPSRKLERPIEKVITYQNRSQEQLKAEISEYVVTDHIDYNFQDLLTKMQRAQGGGMGHEIGVWISGFYGSGKSSFTKYLGFSLDRDMQLGGDPFLRLLQNQIPSVETRALFNTVSSVYDAAVIFLDLASEMLAGASMADISTVLYLKVLQWAGYSEDIKVAELERKLEADGKLTAFLKRVREEQNGIEWSTVHNQPLVANTLAARLATEFYPNLYPSPSDFYELTIDLALPENKRVEEMIKLIRQKSGKTNIIFIIDEVGQYVSAKPSLILNLDGLAKNLKDIGGGSVWIFSTAQQTLTEDNPTAALNAPDLFKLKDRFPIQVHLEASDIKEICHKRLLTKSADGEKELAALYDRYGASLRTSTQLTDAGVYEIHLTKDLFVNLYPFLPAHFEILLQLLGRLAKKTGGLGLRSAIKVVQEVLIERSDENSPLADAPIGALANTITFYDSLRRDIGSSFPHVVDGVQRVHERMPNDTLCQEVAKSIAILQILENLPVTTANIAALMQADVQSPSRKDQVEQAISNMLDDSMIPLGEKDGSFRFLTQAAVTLQQQFDKIEYRNVDLQQQVNSALRALFNPLPSARLAQVRSVTAGLRVMTGGSQYNPLEGTREAIQFHVEFVPSESYDSLRGDREIDSMSARERSHIYLLGRADPEINQLAVTMYRCERFLNDYRTVADPETQEFIRNIEARRRRATSELERKLSTSLLQGSFVAHGGHESVANRGDDVLSASCTYLADMAAKVFDRYIEAPHQAESILAQRFLTTPLDRITTNDDPLSLVTRTGGQASIKIDHKALVSIRDFLGQSGQVDGRNILDHFMAPPYGWSKDTTRYLLAAAFLGGMVKLRIAGQDHQVKSDDSLAAFATNRSFSAVGISLRDEAPDPNALLRASDRLRNLSGENILPLEDEVAAAAKRHIPTYQAAFGPLAVQLRNLDLPDEYAERIESLVSNLTEVIRGDGSDAVARLGGTESPLYDDLLWARSLKRSLDGGLRKRLAHIQRLRRDIESLPDRGIPGKLRTQATPILADIGSILSSTSFFEKGPALATHSDNLDNQIASIVAELSAEQQQIRTETANGWETSPYWPHLDTEDRDWFLQQLNQPTKPVPPDINGLQELIKHSYDLNELVRDLGKQITERADEKHKPGGNSEQKPETSEEGTPPGTIEKPLYLSHTLQSEQQITDLIQQLSDFLAEIKAGNTLRITCSILEDSHTVPNKTY